MRQSLSKLSIRVVVENYKVVGTGQVAEVKHILSRDEPRMTAVHDNHVTPLLWMLLPELWHTFNRVTINNSEAIGEAASDLTRSHFRAFESVDVE